MSAPQKIDHLIGLDRCREILSWPMDPLDPLRLSMKLQVVRVVLRIGTKAVLDGSLHREAERERRAASKNSHTGFAPYPTDRPAARYGKIPG